MKRKILYITDTGVIVGGGEMSFLGLLERIDRSIFELYVVLPVEGNLSQRARELGAIVSIFEYKKVLNPFNISQTIRSINQLADLIIRQKIDLVHTNSTGGVMFLAALASKIAHRPLLTHTRILNSGWFSDLAQGIFSDKIILISERIKRKLSFLPFRRKSVVIYNGVDLKLFRPGLFATGLREEIGCQQNTFLIGCVSSYQWGKGLEYAIKAIKLVRKEIPNLKFIIVGIETNPGYRDYLKKLIKRLGLNDAVILSGRRDDIPSVLSALDVFVFPSLIDAFGRVLIEAMACAKPIVAFQCGASTEIIIDGESGFLTRSADSRGLAEKLKVLLRDNALREQFANKALIRCKEKFDLDLHARNIQRLYLQLLQDESLGYFPCGLCGSADYRPLITCMISKQDAQISERKLSLCRCKNCGLVYLNPLPKSVLAGSAELYSKEYFESGYMKFYGDEETGGLQSNEPFNFRMRLIGKYKSKGVMLDVGCASGSFLAYARTQGWDTRGVDISDYALEVARTKHKLEVTKGTLEEAKFPERFFDLICAGDLLEHTQNPLAFLEEVRRILKDDGILYLAVPDFGSLHYQLMSWLARFNHKNYFVLPHHLYHFTRKTLQNALGKAGFQVLLWQETESKLQEKGLKRLAMQFIFSTASILHLKDRMVIIAKKSRG